MKSRLKKKVEKSLMAEKICELQREICEHERFLGDLLVVLARPTQDRRFIKHGTAHCDYFEFIWNKIYELLQENDELKEKLAQDLHTDNGGQVSYSR